MSVLEAKGRLRKQLSLLDVYAIATGATLSSGLFLLPGIAAGLVGPGVVLCYLIAAVPLVPAMFAVMELGTAMPRAGGAYYFLDRSLGPLAGTVGGFGTWLALALKTAFALIGMGAYTALFLEDAPDTVIACVFALAFGAVNLAGSRKSGHIQIVFVATLLAILVWFIVKGVGSMEPARFQGFADAGLGPILSTAGVVYVSYVGVTKVASVSEEIEDPERNLPLGVFLALATAVGIYVLCIVVMTGVIPRDEFAGSTSPMALAAGHVAGRTGMIVVSIAAILAFASVANAGILSASRYPLAMSRDHLLPGWCGRLTARRTPISGILLTVGLLLAILLLLDPLKIAKLASAFQLLMFALLCGAVIVMRESRIDSYDPGFRTPFYPWMPILGIVAPIFLIAEMGALPIVFSIGLIVAGLLWYMHYARGRVHRHGAIYHVFERLGRQRFDDLDRELRGILKEKGLRAADPFVEVVARAAVIDAPDGVTFEAMVREASRRLSGRVGQGEEVLRRSFLEGTRIGATPVSKGAALPHIRVAGLEGPEMVIVRSRRGIHIDIGGVLGEGTSTAIGHAIFFLVSPEADPGQHLRLLAELASRVDEETFLDEWRDAPDAQRIQELLLQRDRYLSVSLEPDGPAAGLIDRSIRDIDLPDGCLVALVRRDGDSIVPGGGTVLEAGDRLAIIGSDGAIRACRERFPVVPGSGAA